VSDDSCQLAGGCACGHLRFRLTKMPLVVHCCHCHWCQQQSGSHYAVNAVVESKWLEMDHGTPTMVDAPTPSGAGQLIATCPHCRTTIWTHCYGFGAQDRVSFLRVGTLDSPGRLPEDVHIFTESKVPGLTLPSDKPSFPQYYDKAEVWPQESLARLSEVCTSA
jgi:hypothetical protein